MKRTKELAMKRLLSALLAAAFLAAPLPAFAQTAEPAPATEAPAPGEAPASSTGVNTVSGEQEGEANVAAAEEHATPHYPLKKPEHMDWSFAGPFGKWDLGQLQRGMQVYREVCSSCHSMNLVAFRNLEALGYSDAQVRALAAEYQIQDGPDANGEMFERPGIPSDHFPAPFPNPEAAAASNGGAHPPDFSLIAKARAVERGFPTFVFDIFTQYAEGGPDYIHALLTGYGEEPPAGLELQPGTHYNPYFIASSALAMAQPISDGQVTYGDGSPETVEQYSRDISAFLMWAAEPHLVERKSLGFVVMIFLIGFAGMLYAVKRRVWSKIPH
jgi:ubiquinol-cytochrome c reductase cytochrome c1 subunit